jgi:alcohol dehydrogenase
MGGVGRAGGADLARPYPWLMRNDITVRGKFMYPREAVTEMVRPARSELVDLDLFDLTEFGLDDVNDAVAHDAARAGPLHRTVLRPDRAAPAAIIG